MPRESVITLLHRLDQFVTWANPVTAAAEIRAILDQAQAECGDPPPGDPAALDRAATAFGTATQSLLGFNERSGIVADQRIPASWTGLSGTEAKNAITATAHGVGVSATALIDAKNALTDLSRGLRAAQDEHAEGTRKLADASEHLDKVLHARWYQVALDPFGSMSDLWDAAAQGIAGLRTCLAAYDGAEDAGRRATGRFREIAGNATVGPVPPGGRLTALDSLVLADQSIGLTDPPMLLQGSALTPAQLARAEQLLAGLPADEYQAMVDVLAKADTDRARAYLMKALAAGHSVPEVVRFAAKVDLLREYDLDPMLMPFTPGQQQTFQYFDGKGGKVDLAQIDNTTCAEAAIIVARAMADPMYAFDLTTGGDPTDPAAVSADGFSKRFEAEQRRLHDETAKDALGPIDWPKSLGTTPWAMADELNNHRDATGVDYRVRFVDSADGDELDDALSRLTASVDAGTPVPMLVGGTLPRHWVLAIGHANDKIQFYEPGTGQSHTVTVDDLRTGSDEMKKQLGGWDRVQAVIVPTG